MNGQAHNFFLQLLSNGSLSVFLPLNCNIRQLDFDLVSLSGNFQSPKDYSVSDRRKLDMLRYYQMR